MKVNFNEIFNRAKINSVKNTTYRINVEVSFLANFFVQFEKQPNVPIIKEYYASVWNKDLIFPEDYNISFKVFVRNPSCLYGEKVTLMIKNMKDDGEIVSKTFNLDNKNTGLDSEWFRISLH